MAEKYHSKITVSPDGKAEFHNNVDFCVGTGRMGLALQKEYFDQLALVQREIGFKHIADTVSLLMTWRYIMNMRRTERRRSNIISPISTL